MTLHAFERSLRAAPHHLSAFLMLGDPTPEISFDLAVAAIDGGATMLELGIPFSDPCADGPAIQRSCLRAREAGVSTSQAFEIMTRVHEARPSVPLNLLVYGNLIHAKGYAGFCAEAARCGASTLLVPDVPFEESPPLVAAVAEAGVGHVSLVGPLTSTARLHALDRSTTGFLYLAGYQGVTGRGRPSSSTDQLADVAQEARNPVCLGFGISTPTQVASAFAAGARIVVVGSHLARSIDAAIEEVGAVDRDKILEHFQLALSSLTRVSTHHDQDSGEARCS